MQKRKIIIPNRSGIHIRTAAELANLCEKFACKVKICWSGQEFDGRSIMELLHARIRQGDEIIVETDGEEEEKAADQIEECIGCWR